MSAVLSDNSRGGFTMDLQLMQFVMRILALALLYCVLHVIYFGINTRRYRNDPVLRPLLVRKHKRYVIACVAIIVLIIAVVEGIVVPHLGRHYFPLLDIHLLFCAIMVVSGALAMIRNGSRSPNHRLFAYVAAVSAIMVCITGLAVTCYI